MFMIVNDDTNYVRFVSYPDHLDSPSLEKLVVHLGFKVLAYAKELTFHHVDESVPEELYHFIEPWDFLSEISESWDYLTQPLTQYLFKHWVSVADMRKTLQGEMGRTVEDIDLIYQLKKFKSIAVSKGLLPEK